MTTERLIDYQGTVSIWDEHGQTLTGWPQTMETSLPVYLALGDIDGDSDYEVIAVDDVDRTLFAWHAETGALVQGLWPLQLENRNGIIAASPVLADLDGDGDSEIIVALNEDSRTADGLAAIQGDGRFLWQRRMTSEGPISVADVDRDGDVEIALCGYGPGMSRVYTYLLDHQGRPLHRWQGGSPLGTVFADLDRNGQTELLFCAESRVQAVQTDGDALWASRAYDALDEAGAFSVGDLNYDGFQEMMLASDDYRLHVKDLPVSPFDARPDWGMHRHDPQNSGWSATAPSLDPIDGATEVQAGQRLEFQVTTSNPWKLVARLIVGDLPQGAHMDKKTGLFSWKTTLDQAFQTYRLSFTVTDGVRQHRRVLPVTVVPDAIYHADMNTDPNWTLDGGWAWGVPTGAGSWSGDPYTGRTGKNVLGVVLEGDYPNLLTQSRYAITPAIDCRGYHDLRLGFWRWLGLESPYDRAQRQISNDRVNWTDLWTSGHFHISDETWQFVEYALPADLADDQRTVFIRWGIGPTDSSVSAPGWNIDDVQISGARHRVR